MTRTSRARNTVLAVALISSVIGGCSDDDKTEDAGASDAATADSGSDAATADSGSDAATADSGSDAGSTQDATIADSGQDAGMICSPATAECAGNVARVCAATGTTWNEITCSNGCNEGVCSALSLATGWSVHQFMLLNDSVTTPANYQFEDDGLVAIQSANPMASAYLYDTVLPESIVVVGRFAVETTSDDDLIGFVFGWQDPEHFYLVDWKQSQQNDGTCGLAEEGATLKVASSSTAIDDCNDFWRSGGTSRMTTIVPVSENPEGWEDMVVYDLRLEFKPGDINVLITRGSTIAVEISSTDTTYRSGKFGFFNYSQEAVRYQAFSISPAD